MAMRNPSHNVVLNELRIKNIIFVSERDLAV